MNTPAENLYESALTIVTTGRLADPLKWTASDAIAKLCEESGELAEAALDKMGKIDKNLAPDSDFEECADTIICAIDVLSQVNLDMSMEDLIAKLSSSIDKKIPTWTSKIYAKGFNRQ